MRCSKCRGVKPDAEFAWKDRTHTRRASHCKACKRAYRKTLYAKPIADYLECECGNRELWIDAIEVMTGSTWHLCLFCGRLLPAPSAWQTSYQALQWVA